MSAEDALLLQLPEAYGPGVMDDRMLWRWFGVLRRMIDDDLSEPYRSRRYTPHELHFEDDLRAAVTEAYARADHSLAEILRMGRSDGIGRSNLPVSGTAPTALEKRCQSCLARLAKAETRAARAWACLLVALGLPVPEWLVSRLIPLLAEEIACIVAAEEFSGFADWTIRTGCLRVFGGYIDPEGRHVLADAFVHPPMHEEGWFMDWPMLWSEGDGRDLDGFLLTSFKIPCQGGALRLSARMASYDGTRSRAGPVPTLVVHHGAGLDAPYSLITLHRPPGVVWGKPLNSGQAAAVERFVLGNQTPLYDHWRAETDSLTFLKQLVLPAEPAATDKSKGGADER